MEIKRRSVISALLGLGFFPNSSIALSSNRDQVKSRFASAVSNAKGEHFLAFYRRGNEKLTLHRLPGRGHQPCVSLNSKYIVMLARRPGTWMVVFDKENETLVGHAECPRGRHFYGHGAFNVRGDLLFTTENEFDEGRGVIGVYELGESVKRKFEFSSHGVGPHDIKTLSNGDIVVANGGIQTHPDYGRRKLNIDSMESNVVIFCGQRFGLKSMARLDEPKLSLRHLAINASDQIVVAAQHQSGDSQVAPLVYYLDAQAQLRTFTRQPTESIASMRSYIASVGFNVSGEYLVSTAPRGDCISLWGFKHKQWLADVPLFDVAGVSASRNRSDFILSSGGGEIYAFKPEQQAVSVIYSSEYFYWDNHLTYTS